MTNESPIITLVEELRVIGYADAFDENTVPSRVAPIFLFRDRAHSHECLFPPFRLSGPYVCDGAIGPLSDFEEMVAEGLATKIDPPRDAQPARMLWIDENLEPHYAPQTEENQRLREMADQRLKLAYSQFRRGRFDDALQSARWAAAADEASSPAIWLQAAVYRAKEARGLIDSAVADRAVGILQDWARSRPNVSLFDHEVQTLVKDSPKAHGLYAAEPSSELPHGMRALVEEEVTKQLVDILSRIKSQDKGLRIQRSFTSSIRTDLDVLMTDVSKSMQTGPEETWKSQ